MNQDDDSPLASRDFLRLWAAQTASVVGDRLHQIALMWWTMAQTGSVGMTGLVLIATTLPGVLLGPIAGTLADRHDRRWIMVGADLARGGLTAVLAYFALMNSLPFGLLVAFSAVLAALTALFTPANMAMAPSVVAPSQLLRANALLQITQQTAGLLGPVLGGLVVAMAGVGGAFSINAASFLVSAVLLLGLPARGQAAPAASEPFGRAMWHGLTLLRRDPTIGGLLACFALLNVFTMPMILFLPYFASAVFHAGAGGLGLLEGAIGGGMLAAALLWAGAGQTGQVFGVVGAGMATAAIASIWLGTVVYFPAHLAGLALAGFAIGSLNVVVVAFFQERVPAVEMGRFMGLLSTVCSALIPISFGLYGALAEAIAPTALLVCNGVGIGLVAAALFAVPGLREPVPTPAAER